MTDYLQSLNPQQREAVTAPPGPTLVLAGPGSGKTRVLTYRVAYLIGALGVRPFHILAVTFTNKAAREMASRIAEAVGGQIRGVSVGTFHATCARLLRREADHLPIKANFAIADADDQQRLIKQVLKDLDYDPKLHSAANLHAAISRLKNEGLFPESFTPTTYGEEITQKVFAEYQKRLLVSNLVDFDDLLLWTYHLLQTEQAVRERYARRFQHVLVDEFQDTNFVQYEIVRLLGSHHRNIFVVGDADQSIYSWRGADYRNVLRFEQDFPDAHVLKLEQNYRSVQTILDTATAVISPIHRKHRKNLFTKRERGEKIIIRRLYDPTQEARYVVDTIASLVARGQAQPGDFAIMYRTNAQSRALEESFLRAGLPYRLVGAQRFYGRREIKDIVAYLRLAHNPADEISLMRVINVPRRGIGTKTIAALRTIAQRAGLAPGNLLLHMAAAPGDYEKVFPPRVLNALMSFARPLAQWYELALSTPPATLIERILADTDYKGYLDVSTTEGQERWENLQELHTLASRYAEEGLSAFLEEISLVADQDTLTDEDAPVLLTLHASKGLEFRYVFIVGLVEGLLPHIRSWDDSEGMDEERRLFYVGITRAKDHLHLTYPEMRIQFGYAEPAEPSRFLENIPPELTSGDHPLAQRKSSQQRWEPAPQQPSKPRFHAGMKVRHPRWGQGLIIGSRIKDGAELVDVVFDSVGLKRVDAVLARLEIIS